MRQPKVVAFDAGQTLIDYLSFDTMRGTRAIMPYLISNPKQVTAEELDAFTGRVVAGYIPARRAQFEVSQQTILKTVFSLLQLEFSIPLDEIEELLWKTTPELRPMVHMDELLSALRARGIRTGVISNFDLSPRLLRQTLAELYSQHTFDFIAVSSEYGLRKPNSFLFEIGIAQSGAAPEEIWYVGDDPKTDAEGSRACGMQPILYRHPHGKYDHLPEGLITVSDLREVIGFLE